MALNVDGKSGTTGTLSIGSTPENKKGLLDLSLDVGDHPREPRDKAARQHRPADAMRRTGRFALSLNLLPSVAGGLLNIGSDVLGGRSRRRRKKHMRQAHKKEPTRIERAASE
jgi:hypothetical protein